MIERASVSLLTLNVDVKSVQASEKREEEVKPLCVRYSSV